MSKGKTALLIIIALVVLGLLIWLGSEQPANPGADMNGDDANPEATSTPDNGDVPVDEDAPDVEDPADAPDGEEEEEGPVTRNLPPAVFNTSGEVTAVGSNSLTVDSDASHMTEGASAEVTVNITDSTNIFDSEGNSISLSDLSVGDQVSIESPDNIRNETEFEASNINVSDL